MTTGEKTSEKPPVEKIKMGQVIAGSLASVTAAILGSQVGVEGTLIGAGLASAVSTVGSSFYLRSIHHTKRGVHVVKTKVVTRTGRSATTDGSGRIRVSGNLNDSAATIRFPVDEIAAVAPEPAPWRRLPWRAMIAGTVLVFFLAMLLVTGIEWARGEPLSGDGSGTTIGRVSNIQPSEPGPAPERPLTPPSWTTEELSVPPETSEAPSTEWEPSTSEEIPSEPSPETTAPETEDSGLLPPPLVTEEPTEEDVPPST